MGLRDKISLVKDYGIATHSQVVFTDFDSSDDKNYFACLIEKMDNRHARFYKEDKGLRSAA